MDSSVFLWIPAAYFPASYLFPRLIFIPGDRPFLAPAGWTAHPLGPGQALPQAFNLGRQPGQTVHGELLTFDQAGIDFAVGEDHVPYALPGPAQEIIRRRQAGAAKGQ